MHSDLCIILKLYIVNGLGDNSLGSDSAGMKHMHLKEIRISVLSVLIHIYVPYMQEYI